MTRVGEVIRVQDVQLVRARKFAPNAVDQAAFAISNVLLTASFVRFGSSQDLAEFALLYTAWAWCLVVFRTVISERLLVRLGETTADSAETRRVLVASAIGAVGMVGLAVAVGGTALTYALGGLSAFTVVFFVMLPALLLQDLCRYWQIGSGRASLAMRADLVWLAAQFVMVGAIEFGAIARDGVVIWVSWALPGVLSLVLFPLWSGQLWEASARAARHLSWFGQEGRRSFDMLVDAVLGRGALLVGQLLVGALVSPVLLVPIRLGRSAMGPLQSLSMLATTASLPPLARLARVDAQAAIRRAALVGAGVGLTGLAYGAVLSFGLRLVDFGEFSSTDSRLAILFFAALAILQGGTLAGRLILKAQSRTAELARIRVVTGPISIGGSALLAIQFGWPGLILASAIVTAATLTLMARTLWRSK